MTQQDMEQPKGSDSECAAQVGLGCRLTLGDLRQIISCAYDCHFPSLIRSSPWRRMQDSGSTSVAKGNYGQSNLAKAFSMSDADVRDFVSVSRAWQAVAGMARAELEWRDSLRRLRHFDLLERSSMAVPSSRAFTLVHRS
jgi:hypothetical protein